MTKKRFFKLRQALVTKVVVDAKRNGVKADGKSLYKMPTPKFGTEITIGKYAGQKLTSYEQAWETLRPLRDVYGM